MKSPRVTTGPIPVEGRGERSSTMVYCSNSSVPTPASSLHTSKDFRMNFPYLLERRKKQKKDWPEPVRTPTQSVQPDLPCTTPRLFLFYLLRPKDCSSHRTSRYSTEKGDLRRKVLITTFSFRKKFLWCITSKEFTKVRDSDFSQYHVRTYTHTRIHVRGNMKEM